MNQGWVKISSLPMKTLRNSRSNCPRASHFGHPVLIHTNMLMSIALMNPLLCGYRPTWVFVFEPSKGDQSVSCKEPISNAALDFFPESVKHTVGFDTSTLILCNNPLTKSPRIQMCNHLNADDLLPLLMNYHRESQHMT